MLGLGVIAKVPAEVPPALSTLIQQAKAGVPAAEFTLGLAYYEGKDGLHPNPVKALYWFRKAATQGLAQAEFNLGAYHANGEGGLHPNPVKALYWFRKAAAQGLAQAEFSLGTYHAKGEGGLHPNPVKALYWFRKAAAQRNAQAEYVLGFYHAKGEGGLHPNSVKALYWYRKAAAQGFKPAIAKLQALENSPRTKLARSAPQPAQAPAAAPIDNERVARSLQSFWTLYFRASNAQVVDFGTPALVRPVGFGN